MNRLLSMTVFAGTLIPSMILAQQVDRLMDTSNATTTGIVTAMSPVQVTMDVSGSSRNFPVNEVKWISYAGEPTELNRARQAIIAERYEDARSNLARIQQLPDVRPIIQQDVAYYRALAEARLALGGGGDKNAAVRAMVTFLSGSGKGSYHFYEGTEVVGDLAVALGSYDNAVKYYTDVAKAPWPDYKMRAAVSVARTRIAQGDWADAQKKLQVVVGSSIDTPAAMQQKQMAQAGIALCLAETGEHDRGIQIALDLITKNDPDRDRLLFGRAYNAMGRGHFKAGNVKEAVRDYLHTHLLYASEPEVHAEALYYLSKLWNDPALKRSDRASSMRAILRERYSGSPWAKKS